MVKVAIGLGSNLGNSLATLKDSLAALNRIPGIQLSKTSSWYKTKPVGPPQPDYINGCAILEVELTPPELLVQLMATESQFGRVRRERWGARTLDLDLILYGNLTLDSSELTIPHPRMRERAFVLVPLAEIAPNWVDPITDKAIARLATNLDRSGIERLV